MGMFDWIEWEGHKYQTKDTPNQLCDEYRITQLGLLLVDTGLRVIAEYFNRMMAN